MRSRMVRTLPDYVFASILIHAVDDPSFPLPGARVLHPHTETHPYMPSLFSIDVWTGVSKFPGGGKDKLQGPLYCAGVRQSSSQEGRGLSSLSLYDRCPNDSMLSTPNILHYLEYALTKRPTDNTAMNNLKANLDRRVPEGVSMWVGELENRTRGAEDLEDIIFVEARQQEDSSLPVLSEPGGPAGPPRVNIVPRQRPQTQPLIGFEGDNADRLLLIVNDSMDTLITARRAPIRSVTMLLTEIRALLDSVKLEDLRQKSLAGLGNLDELGLGTSVGGVIHQCLIFFTHSRHQHVSS